MDRSDRQLLPALAGLTLAAMLVIAFGLDFAIIGTTGGQPVFGLQTIGADLVRAQGSRIWPLEAWIYVLMLVQFLVFAFGVYRAFRSQDGTGLAGLGLAALTIFWIFSTVHNAAIVTVVQVLAPAYRPGAADAPGLEAAARALLGLGNTLFIPGGGVGTLLQVIGMFSLGQATLRSPRFSCWIGYVALACAALSLLGYLQYLFMPLLVLALLGHVLYIVWQAAVSARMLREPAPGQAEYPAAGATSVAARARP